jgi:hypothetical protein
MVGTPHDQAPAIRTLLNIGDIDFGFGDTMFVAPEFCCCVFWFE